MDKWEKVVALHRLLRNSRYSVPKEKILHELACSNATFHRLRNFLEYRLGAPVERDDTYGGYRYNEGERDQFELPGLWFTSGELEALASLEHALTALGEGLVTRILSPLRGRLDPLLHAQNINPKRFRDRIKILPMGERNVTPDLMKACAEAVLKSQCTQIVYRSLSEDSELTRAVSPQALVRYRDNWYLDAWCHLREDLRTFSLNRVRQLRPYNSEYHEVAPSELKEHFASSYGIFSGPANKEARIRFTGIAAREVSEETWHPCQAGGWLDGTYELTVPYGDDSELIMDILRWGAGAEVVEPVELRERVRNALQKALDLYHE